MSLPFDLGDLGNNLGDEVVLGLLLVVGGWSLRAVSHWWWRLRLRRLPSAQLMRTDQTTHAQVVGVPEIRARDTYVTTVDSATHATESVNEGDGPLRLLRVGRHEDPGFVLNVTGSDQGPGLEAALVLLRERHHSEGQGMGNWVAHRGGAFVPDLEVLVPRQMSDLRTVIRFPLTHTTPLDRQVTTHMETNLGFHESWSLHAMQASFYDLFSFDRHEQRYLAIVGIILPADVEPTEPRTTDLEAVSVAELTTWWAQLFGRGGPSDYLREWDEESRVAIVRTLARHGVAL